MGRNKLNFIICGRELCTPTYIHTPEGKKGEDGGGVRQILLPFGEAINSNTRVCVYFMYVLMVCDDDFAPAALGAGAIQEMLLFSRCTLKSPRTPTYTNCHSYNI